jgi:hypothetical protein
LSRLSGFYPKDTYFLFSTESVSIEKKSSMALSVMEQMRLIQQLDEEDKQTIFRLIEKCLPIISLKISTKRILLHYKYRNPLT